MKIVLFLLAVCVVYVSCGSSVKEMQYFQQWAYKKAMEGCFGQENTYHYIIKKKKAMVKCSHQDAPELNLPIFQHPHRIVQALTEGAEMSKYNSYAKYGSPSHPVVPIIINQDDNDGFLEKAVKSYFLKKFLRKLDMEDGHSHEHSHGDMTHNHEHEHERKRRETDDENPFNLGGFLKDKVMAQKEKVASKIGNITCIMHEMGYTDAEGELSLDGIMQCHKESPVHDPWFDKLVEESIQICYDIAQSLPESYLEHHKFGPKVAKLKAYFQCAEKKIVRNCMNKDIKEKLEKHFGSIEDLTKATGLKDTELLPLVYKVIYDDHKYM